MPLHATAFAYVLPRKGLIRSTLPCLETFLDFALCATFFCMMLLLQSVMQCYCNTYQMLRMGLLCLWFVFFMPGLRNVLESVAAVVLLPILR